MPAEIPEDHWADREKHPNPAPKPESAPKYNSIPGVIEVGDYVQTLNRRRALEGFVFDIEKNYACFWAAFYPGGRTARYKTHVENLALVRKGEGNKAQVDKAQVDKAQAGKGW